MKKLFSLVLTMVLMLTLSVSVFAEAGNSHVELTKEVSLDQFLEFAEDEIAVFPFAELDINHIVPANSDGIINTALNMAIDQEIRINVTYTPSTSKLEMGILQPNGVIRYVNISDGKGDHTFTITQRGTHYIYFNNLSSNEVTVKGFAEY